MEMKGNVIFIFNGPDNLSNLQRTKADESVASPRLKSSISFTSVDIPDPSNVGIWVNYNLL